MKLFIAKPKVVSMLDRTKTISVTCPVAMKVSNSIHTAKENLQMQNICNVNMLLTNIYFKLLLLGLLKVLSSLKVSCQIL